MLVECASLYNFMWKKDRNKGYIYGKSQKPGSGGKDCKGENRERQPPSLPRGVNTVSLVKSSKNA